MVTSAQVDSQVGLPVRILERPSTDPCEANYECGRVALASGAVFGRFPPDVGGAIAYERLHVRVLVVGKHAPGCRRSVPQALAPKRGARSLKC